MAKLKLRGTNKQVEEFIENIKNDKLLPERCKWIDIDIRGRVKRLHGVQFSGQWDIFQNKDVQRYIKLGGMIRGFKLAIRDSGSLFDCKIAFNDWMAYVSIWRGRNSLDNTNILLDRLTDHYLTVFN